MDPKVLQSVSKCGARSTLPMDQAWRFHLGDIPAPLPNTHIAAYMANKAGMSRGAAKPRFDDSDWRTLDLPHDWSIEGEFSPENHLSAGYLPRGIAWYRRHFRLEESDRGKHLELRFDGISTDCTIYVNGHLLARNFCGYTPITVNITDVVTYGDQLNVVAVKVEATRPEGWWYEGAGIYRHVWLTKTSAIHIATNGIFIRPEKTSSTNWNTHIETTLINDSPNDRQIEINFQIHSSDGAVKAESTRSATIAPNTSAQFLHSIPFASPELWSLKSPNLYHLQTEIRINGQTVDELSTRFGYRTIRFDPNLGFFLNDEHIKLKGTCNHQDHGGLGVALPDSIHRFRIRRLLEMGSNAYRCAHNPPAPELLDACDELGMLVMDETRNFGSSPEHLDQLKSMILRDRNHPSVILWSICNEETIQGTPIGAKIARTMQQFVKQLDPSRSVTAAVSGGMLSDNCIADAVEVMGINYQLSTYAPYHAKHPNTPLLASETHCALTTRGIYHTDPTKNIFDSYDQEKANWGTTARETWAAISKQPFVAGQFAWTGFDYRGEPSPHQWPSVTSHWGILDLCGFPKDSFYLHKAFFTREPFIHILPHWNWPGKENQPIRVMVYTTCPSAELFLNDKSLGKKPVDPIEMAEWLVPYSPGTLRAIACDPTVETTITTTGDTTSLGLEIDGESTLPADGQHAIPITVFAIDSNGHRVPTAADFVTFSITGPAKIISVANGNPNSHEPGKASSCSLFQGLAQVILQTTTTPGPITLRASAPGLQSAILQLQSIPTAIPPSVERCTPKYFVEGWRMSRISPNRPDPNEKIADHDMNTWQPINPADGAQKQWQQSSGHAIYRAAVKLPKFMQSTGGKLIFHQIIGSAEIFLDGVQLAKKENAATGRLEINLPPSPEKQQLSILVHSKEFPAGIAQAVEITRD